MTFIQPSPKIFQLVLLFNVIATIIYLIPSWIVSSTYCVIDGVSCSEGAISLFGSTPGEGFLIVVFSLLWAVYTFGSLFLVVKGKFTKSHVELTKVISGMTAINALQVAVWAGGKRSYLLDAVNVMPTVDVKEFYFESLQAMIAGASLLIIGQVVVLFFIFSYPDNLFAGQAAENDSHATYQPSTSYDATQNYQNYQVESDQHAL